MNLVEKLLAIDKGEFNKIEKKELNSKSLSKLLGSDTKIMIKAVNGELLSTLISSGLNNDGTVDYAQIFNANAKVAAEGIIEPNLKDETLLKHLEVPTPAEAAKKIFKGEVNRIAGEISELSGFGDDEKMDKEIKN